MNKVYGVALSPYVRKVLFVLEQKNIPYHMETVIPFQVQPDYLQKNPLGKIPCFEDEQVILPESSVICQYLDMRYPEPSCYPAAVADKARALWLEKYADTHMAPVLLTFWLQRKLNPVLLQKPCDDSKVQKAQAGVSHIADWLEQQLPEDGFLFAEGLMLCDVTIAGLFKHAAYADYLISGQDYPRLAAYLQRVWHTAAFSRREQEEQAMLRQFFS